ncbi:RNA polymerase sigma-70 factor (ECF subfamily) [Kineosphaera limosa]|uniref:Putative RNA polymerase ECF-type sigma factor n=1 Tax=Kineosphaera limosa NBRC 100340 TaxID=1184609 RepID=K6WBG4_9MICO|nr:RNA polymerase sigma factor [Kineosphaera limosa]NYE01219.1 RNA polymerase sigma-70 factor (ECF subfamily) [Kineosphaera limosa]GAB96580.1 putative RNA polymerase ECF-type sigma factor [Kineosphaera limosa NBRC 100340]
MTTDRATADADDRARYERVFAATHRRVLAYVVRRVSDPSDAVDIVADTYLVAWRRVADLPDDEQSVAWLLAVARRCLANHRRSHTRRVALTDRLAASLEAIVPPPGEPKELSDVHRALSRLEPEDLELLRLLEWDGLDRAEIATVLGISRNAVRVRLHRARRRFANALASEQPPQPHPRVAAPAYSREGS